MERFFKYMQHFKFYKSSQATIRFRHKLNGLTEPKRHKSSHLRLMALRNIGDSESAELTKFDDLNTISQKISSLKSARVDPAFIQSGSQQNKGNIPKWREKKQGMAQWKLNGTKMQELLGKDQNITNKFKWYTKRSRLTQWRSKPKIAQKLNSPSTSTILNATKPLEKDSSSFEIQSKGIVGGPPNVLVESNKFEESKFEKVVNLSPKSGLYRLGQFRKPNNKYKVTVIVQSASPEQKIVEATVAPPVIPESPKPAESGSMKFSRFPDELGKSLTCFIPFLSDQGVSCAASHPPIYSLSPGHRQMQPLLGQAALAGVSSPFTSFEKSERASMQSLQSYWEKVFGKKNYSSQNSDESTTQSSTADEVSSDEINPSRVRPTEIGSVPKSRVVFSDHVNSESKPKEKVKTRIFRRVGSSWKSIPKIAGQAETPGLNKKEAIKYTSDGKSLIDESTLGVAHFTAVIPNRKNKVVSPEFTQLKYTFPAKLRRKSYKLKMQKKPETKKADMAPVPLPQNVNNSMVSIGGVAGKPNRSKNSREEQRIALEEASQFGNNNSNLSRASSPDSNKLTYPLPTTLGENESTVSTAGGAGKPNRSKNSSEEERIALEEVSYFGINNSNLSRASSPDSDKLTNPLPTTLGENESTVSTAGGAGKLNRRKNSSEEERIALEEASKLGINNSNLSMDSNPNTNVLTYPLPTTLNEDVESPRLSKKWKSYTHEVFKSSSKKKLQKNQDKINSILLPEQLNQDCKTLRKNAIAEYMPKKKLQYHKSSLDLRLLGNLGSDLKMLLTNPLSNTVYLTNIIKEKLGNKLDALMHKVAMPPLENLKINGKKIVDPVNKVTDSNISTVKKQEIVDQSNEAVASSSSTVEHLQDSNELESNQENTDQTRAIVDSSNSSTTENLENLNELESRSQFVVKENDEVADETKEVVNSSSSTTENLKDSNELESNIEPEMVESNVTEYYDPNIMSVSGIGTSDTATIPNALSQNMKNGLESTIPHVCMNPSTDSTCCSGNSRKPPTSSSGCNVSSSCPPKGGGCNVPPKCPPKSNPCCTVNTRSPPKSSTCCTVNARKGGGGGGPCIPTKRPSPMWEFFSSTEFWLRNAGFINLLLLLLGLFGISRSLAKPTPQELEIEEQERKNAADKVKYEKKCKQKNIKGCIEEKKKLKKQKAAKPPPKQVKKEACEDVKKDVKDASKKDDKTEVQEVKKKGATTAEKCNY